MGRWPSALVSKDSSAMLKVGKYQSSVSEIGIEFSTDFWKHKKVKSAGENF